MPTLPDGDLSWEKEQGEEVNPFTQTPASQNAPPGEDVIDKNDNDIDLEALEMIQTQSAAKWQQAEDQVDEEMREYNEIADDRTPFKPIGGDSVVKNGAPDPDSDEEEMQDDEFVGHLTQLQSKRRQRGTLVDSPATASRRARGEPITPQTSPTQQGRNPFFPGSPPSSPTSSRMTTPRQNLFTRGGTPNSAHSTTFSMSPKRTPGVSLNSPTKMVTPSKLRFVSTGHDLGIDDEEDLFRDSTARKRLFEAMQHGDHRPRDQALTTSQRLKDVRKASSDGTSSPEEEIVTFPPNQSRKSPTMNENGTLNNGPVSVALSPTHRSLPDTTRNGLHEESDGTDNESQKEPSQLDPTYKDPSLAENTGQSGVDEDGQDAMLEPTFRSPPQDPAPTRPKKRQRFADDAEQPLATFPMSTDPPIIGNSHNRASSTTQQDFTSPNQLKDHTDTESCLWQYNIIPPSRADVEHTIRAFGEPNVIHTKPFFSRQRDVPTTKSNYGTRTFQLRTSNAKDLTPFAFSQQPGTNSIRELSLSTRDTEGVRVWSYRPVPPSRIDTGRWLDDESKISGSLKGFDTRHKLASQLGAPTQVKFRYSDRKKGSNAQRESQAMVCLTLEVFAPSRGRLLADPKQDAIAAVFYCLSNNVANLDQPMSEHGYYSGIWIVESEKNKASRLGPLHDVSVQYLESELDLFNELIDRVREWDPDILAGWEVHGSSWGYLAGRAMEEFGLHLSEELSRVRSAFTRGGASNWNVQQNSAFKVIGRHVFNIWRIMRGDLNLLGYTFENVSYHLLKQR